MISFFLFLMYLAASLLRPIEMLAPELAALRPMLVLWLAAAFTAGIRALSTGKVGASGLTVKLLAAFMFILGISLAFNGWAGGALAAWGEFSTSSMLFALAVLNITSMRRLRVSCHLIVACLLAVSVLGIVSFHTGYMAEELVLRQNVADDADIDPSADLSDIPAEDTSGRYLLRVQALGFLQDPNDLAQAIVFTLPLLLTLWTKGRWLRNFMMVHVPLALFGYTISLTHSRGALFGIAAMLIVGLWRSIGPAKISVVLGAAAIGLAATSFGGGRAISTNEESAGQRIEAWYEGFQMLQRHPLFGVGYGNFTEHHYLTAHNSFVLCFSELGMVGYFTWIALLTVTFAGLNRSIKFSPRGSAESRFALALRISLVGFLACAWFLSRTYQPGLYLLLGLCSAAWYCATPPTGTPAFKLYAAPIAWKGATLAAVFVSVSGVYAFVVASRLLA